MLHHLLWSSDRGDLIKLTDPKTNFGIKKTYFWGVKHTKIHHLTVTLTNYVHYLFSKWPGLGSDGDVENSNHFLLIISLCLIRVGNYSPGKMHQAEGWLPFFMQGGDIVIVPLYVILLCILEGTKKLTVGNVFSPLSLSLRGQVPKFSALGVLPRKCYPANWNS